MSLFKGVTKHDEAQTTPHWSIFRFMKSANIHWERGSVELSIVHTGSERRVHHKWLIAREADSGNSEECLTGILAKLICWRCRLPGLGVLARQLSVRDCRYLFRRDEFHQILPQLGTIGLTIDGVILRDAFIGGADQTLRQTLRRLWGSELREMLHARWAGAVCSRGCGNSKRSRQVHILTAQISLSSMRPVPEMTKKQPMRMWRNW